MTSDASKVARQLLVYGLLILSIPIGLRALDDWSQAPTWWNVSTLTGWCAAIALALAGRVRASARAVQATALLGSATLPVVLIGSGGAAHWLSNVLMGAAATAVLTSRRAVLNLAMALALAGCQIWLAAAGVVPADLQHAMGDTLIMLTTSALGFALFAALVSTRRAVQQAQSDAVVALVAARAAESRALAAIHWDALIHDEVLSVLTAIGHDGPLPHLARAADAVERVRAGRLTLETPLDLRHLVLESVLEIEPSMSTTFEVDDRPCVLPHPVPSALAEAAREALRNVARHAWVDAQTGESSLVMKHASDHVSIVIADAGRGFDPRRVDPTRLGLAISVRGRVEAVGGAVLVKSAPGQGTMVHIEWSAAR